MMTAKIKIEKKYDESKYHGNDSRDIIIGNVIMHWWMVNAITQ